MTVMLNLLDKAEEVDEYCFIPYFVTQIVLWGLQETFFLFFFFILHFFKKITAYYHKKRPLNLELWYGFDKTDIPINYDSVCDRSYCRRIILAKFLIFTALAEAFLGH